jgi:hypothetical protein
MAAGSCHRRPPAHLQDIFGVQSEVAEAVARGGAEVLIQPPFLEFLGPG